MKIVWLGTFRECPSWRYFRRDLKNYVELKCYGESPNPNRLNEMGGDTSHFYKTNINDWIEGYDVKEIERLENPDWIFICAYSSKMNYLNLDKVQTPKAIWIGDPIQDKVRIFPKIKEWKIDKVFCHYWTGTIEPYMEEYKADYYHLPHSVDTKVFYPTGKERSLDLAFAGCINSYWYPLRDKYIRHLNNLRKHKIQISEHFGTIEEYVDLINRARFFLADGGLYRYAVCKYFEIMACQTVPIGAEPLDADILHIKSNFNLAPMRGDHIIEDFIYWIENEKERESLAKAAYETVMKYHTNKIRIKQLLEMLKK